MYGIGLHAFLSYNDSLFPLLPPAEFPLEKEVWYHYHQQEANPDEDRIFGTFIDGTLAAVARCRLHPDGHEVDGVFTLEEFRGRGPCQDRGAGTDRCLRP